MVLFWHQIVKISSIFAVIHGLQNWKCMLYISKTCYHVKKVKYVYCIPSIKRCSCERNYVSEIGSKHGHVTCSVVNTFEKFFVISNKNISCKSKPFSTCEISGISSCNTSSIKGIFFLRPCSKDVDNPSLLPI